MVVLVGHVQLLSTPRTVPHQAPLSMGFSRQEYGGGCHFLIQGILPSQGLNPGLLPCRKILYRFELQQMQQGSPFASCPCISFSVVFYFAFIVQLVGSFPDQGFNPGPWQRKCQVLTTGPPRNPQVFCVLRERFSTFCQPKE